MSFSEPFYHPDYFEFQWEILNFESEDPQAHELGLRQLTEKADAGNRDAMMVLARHFLRGRYRDADQALKWYLEAMRHGESEGWGMLQRQYAHPDDTDMEEAVRRMEAEGYTIEALRQLWDTNK